MATASISTSTSTSASAKRRYVDSQTAREVKQAERQESEAKERVRREDEAPKPSVNAQGQTTGTLINIVA